MAALRATSMGVPDSPTRASKSANQSVCSHRMRSHVGKVTFVLGQTLELEGGEDEIGPNQFSVPLLELKAQSLNGPGLKLPP
jgi:hypothetical protein